MTDKDEKLEKTEKGSLFEFKVNGIEIETPDQELEARTILKLAKEKGAIPLNPEDYVLQGDKGKYGQKDIVNLAEDYLFIAIPDQPTPVA